MTLNGRDAFDEHFLIDMHDGQVQEGRTHGLYPSMEALPTLFFGALALVVCYVDRQRGPSQTTR